MPLYFAYGANMDVEAMRRRCPRSRALGMARLNRHRFAIMPDGFANVVRDPRAAVHGVLWDLALADVRPLDAFEGVTRGHYRKVVQPVVKAAGGTAQALLYIGRGEGGHPLEPYFSDVIAAAQDWMLPEAYMRFLQSFQPSNREASAVRADVPRVQVRFATPFDRL